MINADILLVLDSAGRKEGVPAKVYEYLGCRRPILALAEDDGDTAWVLRTSGIAHRIVHPHDVEGIQKALVELFHLAGSDEITSPAGNGANLFTREAAAGQLAAALEQLRSLGALAVAQ
jgi:hypothetical protein